jgi:hypothetical protein
VKSVAAIHFYAAELSAKAALNPLLLTLVPLVLAQIPFVIAEGALSAALILAQPLPHFKKGTGSAPRGKAIVSEEGSELLINKAGKAFLTPAQPSLIDLAGGEKIFSHDITKDMLRHSNMIHIISQLQNKKEPIKLEPNYDEKILRTLQLIERKKIPEPKLELPIENSAWYFKHFKGSI